jgi:hypothetical protein
MRPGIFSAMYMYRFQTGGAVMNPSTGKPEGPAWPTMRIDTCYYFDLVFVCVV